jgi:hypothetical protein
VGNTQTIASSIYPRFDYWWVLGLLALSVQPLTIHFFPQASGYCGYGYVHDPYDYYVAIFSEAAWKLLAIRFFFAYICRARGRTWLVYSGIAVACTWPWTTFFLLPAYELLVRLFYPDLVQFAHG